jgi:DNA primase
MARKFDDGDIERLKRNISIEAVCREHGIQLDKHGTRDFIGKCPFHEDKNPSFVVTPDKNLFHCMGCNVGGSVIDLVMKLDHLTFRQTVEKLLLVSPTIKRGSVLRSEISHLPSEIPPEKANTLLERVVAVYEKAFAEDTTGRAYLERRGIVDAGLFSTHRVGYANGKLIEILPRDGQLKEELTTVGILLPDGSERFAGCVVFPVYDIAGQLATLYGRKINHGEHGRHKAEEERNDKETSPTNRQSAIENRQFRRHFYLPDRSTGLWNAAAMKTYYEIILVESVIDALSVMMAGYRNVISIQGTNGMNAADIATLKAHGAYGVTLLLDGDKAGREAAARLRPNLEVVGLKVAVKTLPDEEDPNEYLLRLGAAELARFLNSDAQTPDELPPPPNRPIRPNTINRTESIPEGQAQADSTRAKGEASPVPSGTSSTVGNPAVSGVASAKTDLTVTYGLRKYRIMGLEKGPRKLRLTLRIESAGKLHVDTLDLYSAKCRRILAMDLCRIFDEMPETIEGDLDKLLRHCEQLPEHTDTLDTRHSTPVSSMSAKERVEAEIFGTSPTLFDDILADCEKRGLMGERNNVLLLYVTMTSRKRDTPLSVLILSSSGAGKTALQDAVLAFCPPEDLVKLTALSGKALFYKERLSLKNKVLALEEGDGAEEAMYAIRNLISAGELVSESTIKDLATGRLTTMENKVEGPSSVCFTTTKPDIDPETKSRFWVTSIDESREQTRRILSFQRQRQLSDEPLNNPEIEAILRKHRNFQRLLKPLAVKNPYAAQLTYGDDRLQGRRDQPKYLNLIKGIAFLRQMRKKTFFEERGGVTVPYIKADLDDIALANRLAHEILGHSLDELSRPGHDLLILLDEMVTTQLKQLKEKDPDRDPGRAAISFSRREIREFAGWSNSRVHRYLKELLDLEYVVQDSGRNGLLCRYRLAWEGQGKDGTRFVLGLTAPENLTQPTTNP